MNNVRIEMCCCEETILREIGMKELHQKDIAMTYALALRSREAMTMDWGKVNLAIMERWSKAGLIRIKTMAHNRSCFADRSTGRAAVAGEGGGR